MTKTSKSDGEQYKNICELASKHDSIFNKFKRNSKYRRVLEHVTESQGKAYLDIINKEGKDLLKFINKFKENDEYGSPITSDYDKIGKISPTTLRYIKILSDLRKFFGDLNNMDIVEIGAGYGGQCKIISDAISFNSYTIIDLNTVLKLIKKYLTKLRVDKVDYLTQDKLSNDKKYDLLISNYAFSECVKSVQDEYIQKVLNKSKRGYITYNCIESEAYGKEEIIKILSS